MLILPPAEAIGMGDEVIQDQQSPMTHHDTSGHDCCESDSKVQDEDCGTTSSCENCGTASAIVMPFVKLFQPLPTPLDFSGSEAGTHDSYALPLFRPPID